MNTPLQKAAQAVIDRWESPDWKDTPHTAHYVGELRKALDAEIAQTETVDRNLRVTEQAVEPDFYTACAEHNGGWIPLPGYSNETVHGVKSLILEDARKEEWKGTIEGRLFALGWQVMPVYLHPPQPQATTAVPEGYVLVPKETLIGMKGRVNTLATLSLKAERYSVGISIKQTIADILAAAQGEKP